MKRLTLLLVIAAAIFALVGAGVLAAEKKVTVGCKNFTEQFIIGEMMKQLLEDRGFTVEFVSDITTMALREGMDSNDIDISADYTGTTWMQHLGYSHNPALDNNALYWAVKTVEEADNNYICLNPIWNNNTYALACWPEFAEDNNLSTLSDLAAYFNEQDGKVSLFIDFEWSFRPDGLPFMKEFYDFVVDEGSMKTGSPGASVIGLENRECEVAMVFATDGKIAKYDWHVFIDDKSFFPPYDLCPYVRASVLDMYPEIADILGELATTFPGGGESATPEIVAECQGVWQGLVAEVNVEKREPDVVAREYLVEKGLIE